MHATATAPARPIEHTQDIELAAYHEAGHAVAAYMLNVPMRLKCASIDREGGGKVCLRAPMSYLYGPASLDRQRINAEKYAMVQICGGLAQNAVNPQAFKPLDTEQDMHNLVDILLPLAAGDMKEVKAHYRLLTFRAGRLLSLPAVAEAVVKVARALMDRERLQLPELKAIIQSAMQGRAA